MPATLEQRTTPLPTNPLRTSRSLLSEDALVLESPGAGPACADGGHQPLGYLYNTWDPGATDKTEIDAGYYDPDSQTWVDREGLITAGIYTKTRVKTWKSCGCWSYDYPTDDACM